MHVYLWSYVHCVVGPGASRAMFQMRRCPILDVSVTGFSSKNDRSYPLQRDLFLSLAAALVAVHEIKVKTGRFHPLTRRG